MPRHYHNRTREARAVPASAVISVADMLGWLAAGMIDQCYPELTEADIRACLAYAADRERRVLTAS